MTIDQPYAQWVQPIGVDARFRCLNRDDEIVNKSFMTEDVIDIDWSEDAITINFAPEYDEWWDDGLVAVESFAGIIDFISWGDSMLQIDIDTRN